MNRGLGMDRSVGPCIPIFLNDRFSVELGKRPSLPPGLTIKDPSHHQPVVLDSRGSIISFAAPSPPETLA